jgi:hypothetical protein
MYIASSGKWYKKSDSGSTTNWTEIGGAVAETDPVFSVSPAQTITLPQIASWDIAYGWGNHASAGYLLTELDPVYSGDPAFTITSPQIASWDIAYGWGNHASAGYGLLGYPKIIDTGADHYIPLVTTENNTADRNLTINVGDAARTANLWSSLYVGGTAASPVSNVVISSEATAGDAITSGTENTLVGFAAGSAIIAQQKDTFIGWGAGDVNVASFNTAVGNDAMGNTSGAAYGAFLGWEAGLVGNGYYNSGFGVATLRTAGGDYNTAVGYQAMNGNANSNTIDYNTAVGYHALTALTANAANNTGVGSNALVANTSGANNTAVGYNACDAATTGSRNICLGEGTDLANVGDSDALRIGNSVNPTFITGSMAASGDLVFSPSGEVGIGITNPTRKLEVVGNIAATGTVDRDAENYGVMSQYENANVTPIDIINVYHPVRFYSTGIVNGVTFDAGSTGTVASVATYAGGAKIQVTDVAHGLLDGEVVCFANSTDYDGCYIVESKANDTFVVAVAYNADRTFNWYNPSTLKVAKAGIYNVAYHVSIDAASNGDVFKAEMNHNITPLDDTAAQNTFANGVAYGSLGGSSIVSLAAGEYLWISLKNKSGAGDATVYISNMKANWIGNAP